jgi:hypothetical protein
MKHGARNTKYSTKYEILGGEREGFTLIITRTKVVTVVSDPLCALRTKRSIPWTFLKIFGKTPRSLISRKASCDDMTVASLLWQYCWNNFINVDR